MKLALVLLFIGCVAAYCPAEIGQMPSGIAACRYSDQIYNDDASLMRHGSPTRFTLMTSRYVEMVQAARGYNCTGTATIAFNGHNYMQAGLSDDPGIAELIPTVSRLIGLSLANTYDLTICAVIFLGISIGYAGFWRLYADRQLRWAGVALFLCLGIAEARVADVYMFQVSPLVAGIPWLVYFGLRRKTFALDLSAVLLALCCSLCSLVRIGTTTICMAFLVTLFVARHRVERFFLPLLLTILACVPPMVVQRSLIHRRDTILATVGGTATAENGHPRWHNIYIGLGYIPNPEVSEYKDEVAAEKVASIDATAAYASAKYEAILRHEVLRIAMRRPMVLVENLAAKAGIVMLCGAILLYPSRRLIFADRGVLWLDAAFVAAIGMSALNTLIAVPRSSYLLTFLCLTLLYSSVKFSSERYLSKLARTALA